MVVRDGERRRKWACACPTAGRDPLLGIEMSEERGKGGAGWGGRRKYIRSRSKGTVGLTGGDLDEWGPVD